DIVNTMDSGKSSKHKARSHDAQKTKKDADTVVGGGDTKSPIVQESADTQSNPIPNASADTMPGNSEGDTPADNEASVMDNTNGSSDGKIALQAPALRRLKALYLGASNVDNLETETPKSDEDTAGDKGCDHAEVQGDHKSPDHADQGSKKTRKPRKSKSTQGEHDAGKKKHSTGDKKDNMAKGGSCKADLGAPQPGAKRPASDIVANVAADDAALDANPVLAHGLDEKRRSLGFLLAFTATSRPHM
ncbi:unnamed protein product, partial [Effrenium voratum]